MICTRHSVLVALGGLLVLGGCADDGDDGDDGDVRVATDDGEVSAEVDAVTAQLALDELSANVDTTVTGFSSATPPGVTPPARQPVTPTSTTLNVRCNAGGDAAVGGYVNIDAVPVLVDVKVAIQYNACVTNGGTTISGDIEFSQTVAAGSTPLRVETIYQGDVTLSGRVNARCAVDLNVLVDEAGRAIEVGGSFCGQDASVLDLHIEPRWGAQR